MSRERGREGERGKQRRVRYPVWLPLSHAPSWGRGPQPSQVPWLGIKLVTVQCTGRRSALWG